MRGLLVFLFFCLALATATDVKNPHKSKVADKAFLVKQKNIFHLFYHVNQPNIHTDQVKIAKSYSIESNLDKYDEVPVVKEFLYRHRNYMLPKGRTFSVMYDTLSEEATLLFKVMYHAKDYDTFYSTACWAREHVNEQMFVYALSAAILHRKDCEGIILPPPYEVNPHFFFPSDVIDLAYKVKMQGHGYNVSPAVSTVEGNVVVIESNYSNWYHNYNWEQKLAYFTEDIGWNSFYYYNHLDYPFWMDGEKYHLKKDGRGEIYYYLHQQILARYYLERLSNGMGDIPDFSWMWPVETGYDPTLKYPNGIEMPHRPNHFDLKHGELLEHLIQVEDYERRVREAIDLGYVLHWDNVTKHTLLTPEGIEWLASIIEGNADNPHMRYYRHSQIVSRMILGNSPRPVSWHKVHPSAMELYQTTLRDPVFYQMMKRYYGFFKQYKELLTPYTKEELSCPGVKIENVEVEKLVTYFDHYEVEITNALYQTTHETENLEDNVIVHARQHRLNHLPFTVTTNVHSEKPTKVVVRTFLGPKYNGMGDLIPLDENRENFFELDQYVYELKSGKNVLQRNSRDFWYNIEDWPQSRQTYKDINDAIEGKKDFVLDSDTEHNGIPDRLILPKGRKGGMPHYLYVVITPYHAPEVPYGTGYDSDISTGVGSGARFLDSLPLGYPFDRRIDNVDFFFGLNNMHFESVYIFHKKESEINTTVPKTK